MKTIILPLLLLITLLGHSAFSGDIHDKVFVYGNLTQVQALVKNDPQLVFRRDGDGATPLHWAVWGGHKDMVEFLLSKGADINAKDKVGTTPLALALASGMHPDMVAFLRQRGAHK